MNILFTEKSWADYQYWFKTDKRKIKRINTLVNDIKRNPFEGLGKPEPLKYDLQGVWSRRIDHEHRLLYEISESELVIVACRYHY